MVVSVGICKSYGIERFAGVMCLFVFLVRLNLEVKGGMPYHVNSTGA